MKSVFGMRVIHSVMVGLVCLLGVGENCKAQDSKGPITGKVETTGAGKHPNHDLIGAAKGFRVNVHIDNEAYGLQAEQFKRRVESVCSDESLPVSRDPIGESDRRPILYVHINAIPIEMGDNEIGFACSTTVAFKQYLDGRYSDCMVGTYTQPIVFVGGNGDLEMAQYNYQVVKLLVQNFAKVWRECHKE